MKSHTVLGYDSSVRYAALAAAALISAAAFGQEHPGIDPRSAQRLVGILQYLESDYPEAVESGRQSELEEQKSFAAEAIQVSRELGVDPAVYGERLELIRARIERGSDPKGVSRDCADLVEDLVLAAGLARSPRHPPEQDTVKRSFFQDDG